MTRTSVHFSDATRLRPFAYESSGAPVASLAIEDREYGHHGEAGTTIFLRNVEDIRRLRIALDQTEDAFVQLAQEMQVTP